MNVVNRVVVLPSVSELGIIDKDSRGIVREQAPLPLALRPMQGALARVASKLGVDLGQPVAGLQAAFEGALAARGALPDGRPVNSPNLPSPTP